MSVATIIAIVGAAMKIAASIIGDYYLAKWISAARVWLRRFAWQSLKEQLDSEYNKLSAEFEDLCGDRPDCKPPAP